MDLGLSTYKYRKGPLSPADEHMVTGFTNSDQTPSPERIFYGWWIVLAGTTIFIVANGIGFYCHGVFLDPLSVEHGWSKGAISLAVTLYFFTTGVMGIIIGRQIDRFGPRPILILGSMVVGISLLLLGHVKELWHLYAVYFLMAVGWSGTSLIPVNTLITNWFIRKRGLAMSLTMTGLSIGGIIIVPFATFLISRWGLMVALPILGALFWVVIIPLALFVIKQRPSDIGQFPDGEPIVDSPEESSGSTLNYASQMQEWTRSQAMGALAFWSIVVAFFLAMTGQVAYLVHQISFLSQTLGLTGAATAVSITAGASIAGRLLLGSVIDRWDKRYVTMGLFLSQALAILGLAYSNHISVLYLGTLVFGLTMGSILMMQSLIIGECFGLVSFGTVSGLAGLFVSSGAAIGPTIAGVIYDATQSYRKAFIIFAAASLMAMLAICFAKPPLKVSDSTNRTS